MYAATGDVRFKERADYLVKEMKEVQDKRGNGYLGALMDGQGTDGEKLFEQVAQGNIRSGGFDLNGMWSPWYTLHKTYAGLRDAYRYTGNKTALEVEIKFSAWAEGIVSKTDRRPGPADAQHRVRRHERDLRRPLRRHGRHAMAGPVVQVRASSRSSSRSSVIRTTSTASTATRRCPSSSARPTASPTPARPGDIMAAGFFWDRVVQHHTFATGGHGKDEYFGPADMLSDRVDGRTAETCNVYNMLKLTRRLFALRPDAHLRRLPGAGPVQPHPRLDRPQRRPDLLHGAGRPGRAA